ncbi:MAG: hypothetical protein JNL94_15345 [Planctomycetes bacterium]|jgi:hypothetical protein|nr:hypothetical protein [Planctomycetota bacterium]
MRKSVLQTIATWVCLVAYALTGAIAGAHAVVLCVGPNGHVEFELSAGAPCGGCGVESWPELGTEPVSLISSASASQCPCVDIPIAIGSSGPQAQAPNNDSLKHVVIAYAAVETLRLAFPVRCEPVAALRDPQPPLIANLRTVVLLV